MGAEESAPPIPPTGLCVQINPGMMTWSATGGTIEADGVFKAGQDEGNFLVNAMAGGKTATASVTIAKEIEAQPKRPTMQPTKLVWSGNVPHQKWTQLYMKVLTKLVSSGDVKLQV